METRRSGLMRRRGQARRVTRDAEGALVTNTYMLGHTNHELDRLISQGQFLGDLSRHFLQLAGLQPGMRVLDVGCGAGDVSFLAAAIVGASGSVLGIDRAADAVAIASKRAAAAGLANLRFETADVASVAPDLPFDAIVGRLVLMYFPDPAAVVRSLVRAVAPGGLVTFHEFDFDGVRCEPRCPLFDTVMEWMRQTFSRGGAEIRMGAKLGRTFEDAGLPTPQMRLESRVERGPDSPVYDQIAGVMRTILPLVERTGVATLAELDIDTLAERLRHEAVALRATLVSPPLVAAWSRRAD